MSVKALTWEREEADWWVAQPAGMGFGYEVRITDSGRVRVRRGTSNWAYFDGTAEEAKAAFQADFDNLIMWFVDPSYTSSQAEIERLTEALEMCARLLPRYRLAGRTTGDDEELAAVLETVTEALGSKE